MIWCLIIRRNSLCLLQNVQTGSRPTQPPILSPWVNWWKWWRWPLTSIPSCCWEGWIYLYLCGQCQVLLKHWGCGLKSYSSTFGNIFWCCTPEWVEHWLNRDWGDLWCCALCCLWNGCAEVVTRNAILFECKYNIVLQLYVYKRIMTTEHTLVNNFYSPNFN